MDEITFTGKLPHNPEIEARALGLALYHENGYGQVASLTPDDFYDGFHADLWSVIQDLANAHKTITPVTVNAEVEARGGKGDAIRRHIETYAASVVTTIGGPDYVQHLKDLTMRRRAMLSLQQMAGRLQDVSMRSVAADQIGQTVAGLIDIASERNQFVSLAEVGDMLLSGKATKITPTGFAALDEALAGGFHRNRMYGFVGRPKAGKTFFLSSISYNMIEAGHRHAYLALEMTPLGFAQRFYARRMGVNSLDFFRPEKRDTPWFQKRLAQSYEYYKSRDFVDFKVNSRNNLDAIRATIAEIGMSGKYDGVFVDYIQLIGGKQTSQNETTHLDNVCQTLAEMASSYPIWICAAAQMNADGGVRGGTGMAQACDVLFNIENSDEIPFVDSSGRRERRHLSMQYSRYTMNTDIGAPGEPGYLLRTDCGPYFEELS